MKTTTVRLDEETKENSRKLAEIIGISFNDLVTVLLKKAIREGGVDLRKIDLSKKLQRKLKDSSKKQFDLKREMMRYNKRGGR